MAQRSEPMMSVFASMHVTLLDQACDDFVHAHTAFVPIHLHTDEADWYPRLISELSQASLWGDRSLVIVHTDPSGLKAWDPEWLDRWLHSNSTHRVLLLLLGAYTQKHKILQHPKIQSKNLYESKEGPSSKDRAQLAHDPDALMLLNRLKRNDPKAYQQWLHIADTLDPASRSLWVKSQEQDSSIWLLLWVDTVNNVQPVSRFDTLKSSDIMECFIMVGNWVRQALLTDEQGADHNSGFMRWPAVLHTWQAWKQHTSLEERYCWYEAWTRQEATLKGLMHPLDQNHGWQQCLLLTAQWKTKINPQSAGHPK